MLTHIGLVNGVHTHGFVSYLLTSVSLAKILDFSGGN